MLLGLGLGLAGDLPLAYSVNYREERRTASQLLFWKRGETGRVEEEGANVAV